MINCIPTLTPLECIDKTQVNKQMGTRRMYEWTFIKPANQCMIKILVEYIWLNKQMDRIIKQVHKWRHCFVEVSKPVFIDVPINCFVEISKSEIPKLCVV